jgi:hypothetical protein
MHKQKKYAKSHKRTTTHQRQPKSRTIVIEPATFASHVRHAEQEIMPIIKETHLGPAAAVFLMAQYTQMFATGSLRITAKSAKMVTLSVLSLWQDGFYKPGSEYPYTLEETIQDIQNGMKAKKDYTECFQPFVPAQEDSPQGMGQMTGGIVKHPETQLWQIWIIISGECACIGAFQDPLRAQGGLEEFVSLARRGGTQKDVDALYYKISSQGDNVSKMLPYDMMMYILEHSHLYQIKL